MMYLSHTLADIFHTQPQQATEIRRGLRRIDLSTSFWTFCWWICDFVKPTAFCSRWASLEIAMIKPTINRWIDRTERGSHEAHPTDSRRANLLCWRGVYTDLKMELWFRLLNRTEQPSFFGDFGPLAENSIRFHPPPQNTGHSIVH